MSYITVQISADDIHDLIENSLVDYETESDIDDKIEEAIGDADIVSEKEIDRKVYEAVRDAIEHNTLKSETDIEAMIKNAILKGSQQWGK